MYWILIFRNRWYIKFGKVFGRDGYTVGHLYMASQFHLNRLIRCPRYLGLAEKQERGYL